MSDVSTLLPRSVRRLIPPLYAQENVNDPIVYAKLFLPGTYWTWYITEFDPKTERCFGYVVGDYPELGYFSLQELKEVTTTVRLNLINKAGERLAQHTITVSVERDQHFTPTSLAKVKAQHREENNLNLD